MGSAVLTAFNMVMAVIYRTTGRFRSRSGCDNAEKISSLGIQKEDKTEYGTVKPAKTSHTGNRAPLQLYFPPGTMDLK
jgi:hypothetical protein